MLAVYSFEAEIVNVADAQSRSRGQTNGSRAGGWVCPGWLRTGARVLARWPRDGRLGLEPSRLNDGG